jgi:hypothetical protein
MSDPVESVLDGRQKDIRDAYVAFTRKIAELSTHFFEEEFHSPPGPHNRKGVRKERPAEINLDDLISKHHDEQVIRLTHATKQKLQHAALDAVLSGKPFELPRDLPYVSPDDAREYGEISVAELEPVVKGLLKPMPKALREGLPQILRAADLHEHGGMVYFYGLSKDRIVKPEFDKDDSHRIVNASTILSINQMRQLLSDPSAEFYEKHLVDEFKKYSHDARPIVGAVKRKLGIDTEKHHITDDMAMLHNLTRYLFKYAPGAVPVLEAVLKRHGKYFPEGLDNTVQAIGQLKKRYGISDEHFAVSEAKYALRETGLLEFNALSLDSALKAAKKSDKEIIRWTQQFLNDMDLTAKLSKKLVNDPLNGENVEHDDEAEENIRRGSLKIKDRRHALNRRDIHGKYSALERELNKEAGAWYYITHEVFALTSAVLHEAETDAHAFMRKITSHQALLSDEQRKRFKTAVESMPRIIMPHAQFSEAYDHIYRATREKGRSVVSRNPWGSWFDEHKIEVGLFIGRYILRNVADHDRQNQLGAFAKKLKQAVFDGKELEFIVDLLTYHPEDRHTKTYGDIETNETAAARRTISDAARNRIGSLSDVDEVLLRIGTGLARHPDNIKMIYAAGAYLTSVAERQENKDLRVINSARKHLLDVKGWIESSRDSIFKDHDAQADKEEIIYLHHQILSAAEYQLSHLYGTLEEDNEHAAKDLMRSAYKHYTEYAGWVDTKMARGGDKANSIPVWGVIKLDGAEKYSRDPDVLARHLEYAPLNLKVRRELIERLYETGLPHEASRWVERTYNDLFALTSDPSLLTTADILESLRIHRKTIGQKHATLAPAMPSELLNSLSGCSNYNAAIKLSMDDPHVKFVYGVDVKTRRHDYADRTVN